MAEISLEDELNIDDVPSLPSTAAEIMRLINDPDSNASQIAKAISSDQSMTARLLQIANSPFYGRSRGVSTVQDAVVLIGYPAVKGLVISTSTSHLMRDPGLLEVLLWDNSVGAAMAARELAQATKAMDVDAAFTAGLLHDIGRVIMSSMDRERYVQVMKTCYNENMGPRDVLRIENHVFGYDHLDLGLLISQKWRLSDELTIAIQFNNVTDESLSNEEDERYRSPIASLTCLSNLFMYRLGIGTRAPLNIDLAAEPAAKRLKLSEEKIKDLLIRSKKTFDAERKDYDF